MTDFDVIVIGAGPAGCKTAELIAGNGYKVLVVEEHDEIGKPVQCTGIDSHRILELSGVSEKIVLNKVKKARFYSESKNYLELNSKKWVYVIDRHKLDFEIAKKAIKNGAEILTSTRFKDLNIEKDHVKVFTKNGSYTCKILVGADGPNSTVAKKANIDLPKNYLVGYQETIKGYFKENIVELWFGKNITPDFFAWVVPENEKWARVGLASKINAINYFRNFVDMRFHHILNKKDVLGGIIRYGLIKDSTYERILLVGDAASQVKPYSGGGIIYGLIGARFAANTCVEAIKSENYSHKFLNKFYDKQWKKKLSPAIKRGLILHKTLHLSNRILDIGINMLKPFSNMLENLDMDLLFD
ncbi:MAG: NAD(P)/FAD-dependent oxidoreductase [Candidatus Aenigmatarchaeota archaeon]|nr:NAD(P)/FAD-dependent oxidoreductase [Candidatus Aenigmarchaeota archaeon]